MPNPIVHRNLEEQKALDECHRKCCAAVNTAVWAMNEMCGVSLSCHAGNKIAETLQFNNFPIVWDDDMECFVTDKMGSIGR